MNPERQIIISPMVYRLEVLRLEWVEAMGLCIDPLPDRSIINGWMMNHLPNEVEELAIIRFIQFLRV
jgi:hypothetical protein